MVTLKKLNPECYSVDGNIPLKKVVAALLKLAIKEKRTVSCIRSGEHFFVRPNEDINSAYRRILKQIRK